MDRTKPSKEDKRSKLIQVSSLGLQVLENSMDNIRKASKIVSGNLSHTEKLELIQLLQKLDDFHHPIYEQNIDHTELIDKVYKDLELIKN